MPVLSSLRRNLTDEIADIEETHRLARLEHQVECLEESEADKAKEDAGKTPLLMEQSRIANRRRRRASAGNRPDPRPCGNGENHGLWPSMCNLYSSTKAGRPPTTNSPG
jgi:hypothetical protein